MLKISVVTPLAVEGGEKLMSLIGKDTSTLKPEIVERVDKMRVDIKNQHGVMIPGIRFRINNEFGPKEFALLVNEIPVKREPLEGEGSDLLDNLILQIQDAIEENLENFVGHQYVDKLIDDLLKKTTIDTPDMTKLTDFTILLRTMLKDRIPITAFEDILQEYMKCVKKEMEINEIYENVRLLKNVREKLPGNNNWHKFYKLSPEMEEIIRCSIINIGYKDELGLNPKEIHDLLRPIRNEKSKKRILAILVEDSSIRRITQQLVHLEFPSVPVLSRIELLDHLQDFIKGTLTQT